MIREVERLLQLALLTFERIEPLALAFDHLQQLSDRSLLDARELFRSCSMSFSRSTSTRGT
ncbi:MAG: hypothetical protein H6721_32785 [Sandaracinus sp.]|nr:hypothetical protein [Sandaracinus sp.]